MQQTAEVAYYGCGRRRGWLTGGGDRRWWRHFETAVMEAGAPVAGSGDDDGFTSLRAAAILGDASEVELLLTKGALVDVADEDGLMPLKVCL